MLKRILSDAATVASSAAKVAGRAALVQVESSLSSNSSAPHPQDSRSSSRPSNQSSTASSGLSSYQVTSSPSSSSRNAEETVQSGNLSQPTDGQQTIIPFSNSLSATSQPTTPWPTQKISINSSSSSSSPSTSNPPSTSPSTSPSAPLPTPTPPRSSSKTDFSLPPIAPDGTPTEMKVVSTGASKDHSNRSSNRSVEEIQASLKQLDQSLGAYFAEPEEKSSIKDESSRGGPSQQSSRGQGSRVADQASSDDSPLQAQVTSSPGSTELGHDSTLESYPKSSDSSEVEKVSHLPKEKSSTSSESNQHQLEETQAKIQEAVQAEQRREKAAEEAAASSLNEAVEEEEYDAATEIRSTPLRSAKVPSSRLGRLFHYGSLGAGLAWGAAGEFVKGGDPNGGKQGVFMSEANVKRLVDKLSTMRGAALKLGQFMSIQDSNLLPEQIEQIMLRVQNSANYMPVWQMEKVMKEDLGQDWRENFQSFEDIPFASASIGQVHSAVLAKNESFGEMAGKRVAVKIQFPGVRESIVSDLSNLRWLLSASALLPKGLFLENTIKVMSRELDDECDYEREAEMGLKFAEFLKDSKEFSVPIVVKELCGKRVLTTEMMRGRPLTQAKKFTQEKRNQIARSILLLSLRELFTFRLMQTDPNWTNFLYNERTGKIELIDFGATREYSKAFIDDWLRLLRAAVEGRREDCRDWSRKVGYLTGNESEAMLNAHIDSMIALGEPFRSDAPSPYPFKNQTITARVKAQIPLMLKERLTPPPSETYSLNRKLSGAFLLCARLEAEVKCKEMLQIVAGDYKFGAESDSASDAIRRNGEQSKFGSDRRELHTSSRIMRDVENLRREKAGNVEEEGVGFARQENAPLYRPSIDLLSRYSHYGASLSPDSLSQILSSSPQNSTPSSYDTLSTEAVSTSISSTPPNPNDSNPGSIDARRAEQLPAEDRSRANEPATALSETRNADDGKWIRGVFVEKRPEPPGPEDCCMSGCAHCVYDIYAEDLMAHKQSIKQARDRLMDLDPPIDSSEWDASLLGEMPSSSSGDAVEIENGIDEAKKQRDAAEKEILELERGLDPTMKAFLAMERKMKKKEREKLKERAS